MDATPRFAALTALSLLVAAPSVASAQDRPLQPSAPATAPAKAPAKAPARPSAPRAPKPEAPREAAAPVDAAPEAAPVEVEEAPPAEASEPVAEEPTGPASSEGQEHAEGDAAATGRGQKEAPAPEGSEARGEVGPEVALEPSPERPAEPVQGGWSVELRVGIGADDEEERPWTEGEPVPDGWELDTHVNKGLVIAGAVTFGVTWLGSAAWAAHRIQEKEGEDFFQRVGDEEDVEWPRDAALFIPLAGPWIALDAAENGRDRAIMIADGVLQAGGLAMLIAGAVAKDTVIVRSEDEETEVSFVPMATPGAAGASFVGTF